ncbi:DNA/RNA polymerase [Rozella allomycis CSF55]|uniref:acylphosphatase n=1 Tax=Rozella allomycis (strain CSF55) TaxID=988480 RepID=A0A4P9YIW8_ROZAC|nr:DNA/RNA polymerase [Rozella allomycis CSF55]
MTAEQNFVKSTFTIYGKVQGVYFRKFTAIKAKELKLGGFCMNTPGGTVVGEIIEWLKNIGSPNSKIEKAEFGPLLTVESASLKFEIKLPMLPIIIHLDLDCFYCQVEQLRLQIPSSTPLAVQQWQSLIAVNYAARKNGVQRHMSVTEALEACPDLKLVHCAVVSPENVDSWQPFYVEGSPDRNKHKISLDPYRKASKDIISLLSNIDNRIIVEKASIDEVYLDVTELVHQKLSENCEQYSNDLLEAVGSMDWNDLGHFGENCSKFFKADEEYEKVLMCSSWNDLRLHEGAKFGQYIRKLLFDKLGYTCSTGVSHSRMLAKIGSAANKPDQQTIIRYEKRVDFLRHIPVHALPGLGGKLGKKISLLGENVSSILDKSFDELKNSLSVDDETVEWIYKYIRGDIHSEIEKKSFPKSIMSAKALTEFVKKEDVLMGWIRILALEISERWKELFLEFHGIFPKTLTNLLVNNEASLIADKVCHFIKSSIDLKSLLPCRRIAISFTNFEKGQGKHSVWDKVLQKNNSAVENDDSDIEIITQVTPSKSNVKTDLNKKNSKKPKLDSGILKHFKRKSNAQQDCIVIDD